MTDAAEEAKAEVLVRKCGCGKVTTFSCHELWPHKGLTPCHAPLCGVPCDGHRHEPGTMGYVGWVGKTDYKGDVPDAPGLWEKIKSRCRQLFWSPQHKAQSTWDEMIRNFPPPSPFPKLTLVVNGIVYESRDLKMVEVGEEFDPLDERGPGASPT